MNIKEASERTGVNSTAIRYYEKIGLIPTIDRNDVGVRQIDERILRRITFVKQMRAAGMSIEALQEYIQLFDSATDNTAAQRQLLQEQVELMTERRDDLQAAIDHLTWKIEHAEHLADTEAELRALEQQHTDKK